MAPDPSADSSQTRAQSHSKDSNSGHDAELTRQLAAARQSLTAHLHRKKQLDKDLINLEVSIFNFETSYLTTGPGSDGPGSAGGAAAAGGGFGNIVKGYDNYLKQGGGVGASLGDRKRNRASMLGGGGPGDIPSEDRIFSNSSSTHQRALELADPISAGRSPAAPASASTAAQESSDDEQQAPKRRKR